MNTHRCVGIGWTLAAAILGWALLTGCAPEDPTGVQRPESTKYVVPEAGEGVALTAKGDASISIRTNSEAPELKLSLPEHYLVSQVMNKNLDVDETDEQVIVYKNTQSSQDVIRLLVADFDTVRSSYVRAWDGATQASNVRTFAVYLKDLVGDHKTELVAFGMNAQGQQTLDVFRRTNSPSGLGLYYESIASFAADASIEIEEEERSEAYDSAQTTGQSFPISVLNRDRGSENQLDLIKTTYFWNHQENRYIQGSREQIPGREIEEEQLQQLYDGDAADIEEYLGGPWYRSSGPETDAGAQKLAFFDVSARRVVLYEGDTQKHYKWLNSYKTIYRGGPGLWINLRNESIESLRRQVSVGVLAIDEIYINVKSEPSWNGTYRKLSSDLQQSMLANARKGAVSIPDLRLQGLYGNDSGTELFFSSRSRFTMRREGETQSGGYSLYAVGTPGPERKNILELMMLDENGLIEENRVYQLVYEEQRHEERIVRTLELTPAQVGTHGVEPVSNETLTLEQVEELEDSGENGEEGEEGASDGGEAAGSANGPEGSGS